MIPAGDRLRKVVLIVNDGWGIAKAGKGNYITQAKTPNMDFYWKKYPHTLNKAHGAAVGLPEGSQGNSEVGHLHLGAGRVVWQMYEKINRTIKDGSFFRNKVLIRAMQHAKQTRLHLMGLCSDGGIHSHLKHLFALLEMAKKQGVRKIFINFFGDGRDVPEKSAEKYIRLIEQKCRQLGIGKIASIVGRYYAMDRDNNWDRTEEAYNLLTLGKGVKAKTATQAVKQAYRRGDKTDYYLRPALIDEEGLVGDGDAVIFFNFRTDRPRQLTRTFIDKNFREFRRKNCPDVHYATMTQYDKTFHCPFAFTEDNVSQNLAEIISRHGLRQLRMAETDKYAHVTYFFNSQVEKPYRGEERILVPSPKVPSYDATPEMSASGIAEEAVKQIRKKKFHFMLINFANCDLVGHSAIKKAIIRATEVVDGCMGKVVNAALENGYEIIVTADHGNAEDKLYPDGKPKPSHSTNPVPFILISDDKMLKNIRLHRGGQRDVAPTILDLMGIKKPAAMTGKSLIKH